MPTPTAGRGGAPRTPTKLTRRPGQAAGGAQKPTTPQAPKAEKPDVEQQAKPEVSRVEMKDTSEADPSETEELDVQEPKPVDTEETEEAVGGAEEDTADDVTEKAGDVAEDDETEESTGAAGKAGRGLLSAGKGLAGRVQGLGGKAAGAAGKLGRGDVGGAGGYVQEGAGETAEGVQEDAGEAAEGAQDGIEGAKGQVEDATGQELPDVNIMKGLEVDEQGLVHDDDGNAIGKLVEGDAEDLVGYKIGDDGEILDDDGDLVGRCELLPEKAQELIRQAQEQAEGAAGELPDISILEGLAVGFDGNVLNEDGDTVGQLIEGDPKELQGMVFNKNGEILDNEGNVIGRAEVHPEAAALYEQAEDLGEDVEGQAGEAVDGVEGAIDEAELPGVEALEGHQVNEEGQVVDAEGNVIGQLAEGDIAATKGLTINEKGEVVDEEGNVIGRVELAEGAAERLAAAAGALKPDIRILEGLKVNKKGKILNEEGEEIGELVDGDPQECAGKLVNGKGEVLDKQGDIIGRVKIVPGEAADEATKILLEKLGELPGGTYLPDLEILEGLKINKKGKILNEDGEEIGELVDGDLEKCKGLKCNANGEVLDKNGKVVGRVRTLPQDIEEGAEGVQEGLEEGVEEGFELPPLSILEGLTVNKAGKLVNADGIIVGELIEGDAKKLSKLGVQADDQGQFWDTKGHIIGRAQTVPVEEPEEEAPFAGLEGLIVNRDGYVEDENGNIVGQVVEGNVKKLVGRGVDEDGDILDKRGSVVGHAERLEEPEPEQEYADLSSLAGKTVNKQGNVIGDDGVPVARLVEGNPKELAGRKLDANGQIWNDQGEVIGRVELIPQEEREAKPEGPFAGLFGLKVVQGGKVADEDGNIVGEIVEGNPKRLVGLAVDEDGDIIDKYGNVKGHADPLPEEEEEPEDLSILENKVLNKQGFVVGDDGIPIGRLVEGNVKDLAGRRCDDQGLIYSDTGKVVGRCEVIPENERVAKPEGPFAGYEGLRVVKDGWIEDEDGNRVGILVEGNPKRLVGHGVDEDGDIIDKYGNVKGHAEPWEEEEEPEADLSALAGCTVNKAGNVVDSAGAIVGCVAEGDLKNLIGRKVDGQGRIWDNSGNVIGRAELATGVDTAPEGPFAGFDGAVVHKDGTVQTPSGDIIGRVIEGDIKKLVGHTVDEEGDIVDKNGNPIGKAERWEPEEKERRINPMAGLHVNKEGEVRDQNGDLIGRLTAGDLGHCAGLEIDDNGYVVDNDGNKVGEVTLLENLVEEEPELTEEEAQRKKDAELAEKMANICQQTLERVQPVCKQITEVSFTFPNSIIAVNECSLAISTSNKPTARPARNSTKKSSSTTSSPSSKKAAASCKNATARSAVSIPTGASPLRPKVALALAKPRPRSTALRICSRRSLRRSSRRSTTRRRRSRTCRMRRRSSTRFGRCSPSRCSRSLRRLACFCLVCLGSWESC